MVSESSVYPLSVFLNCSIQDNRIILELKDLYNVYVNISKKEWVFPLQIILTSD